MFKNPFNKKFFNELKSHSKIDFKKYNGLYNTTPRNHYSKLDKFLGRLSKPVYFYLIGANLGVYLAWHTGFFSQRWLFNNFTLSQWTMYNRRYHTMLTYSLSHIDFFHLLMNMVTLYFFGSAVEAYFGSKLLLQLYFGGALGSAFFAHSANKKYNISTPTVGASGAIAAILSYYILNFPNQIIYLYFIPVPAWVLGILFVGQSFFTYDGRGGVSGSSHFGGMVTGLLFWIWKRGGIRF